MMTSVQTHTESKVYRAMQFWRYHENLQEMIFQSMPHRISKCHIFTDKIAIQNKKLQKKRKVLLYLKGKRGAST